MQILILIFAEVLGLYGLIVALIMNTKAGEMTGVVSRPSPFSNCLPALTVCVSLFSVVAHKAIHIIKRSRMGRDGGSIHMIDNSKWNFVFSSFIREMLSVSPSCALVYVWCTEFCK